MATVLTLAPAPYLAQKEKGMKRTMSFFCCTVAFGATAPAFAQDMPSRKPGLWETTMNSPQAAGQNMVSLQCIDEKTDAAMLKKGMHGNDASCQQQSMKRTANSVEFDSVCKQADGVMTSRVTMTGDFKSQYKMEIKGKLTPPKNGMGEFQSTMNARHMGACPADMKPGDMKINGMVIRADGMPANISPQQAEQVKKMMEQMKKQMQK